MMKLKESNENKENQEKFREMQSLLEKEQLRAQLYFEQLKETQEELAKKQEEVQLSAGKKQQTPIKINVNQITLLKEAKGLVDSIIQTLSRPNDSKNLIKVSKDLLDLQDFMATNLVKGEDKINSLIKRNPSANSSSNHKHSPSSNIESNIVRTEPHENVRTSNFNIYKTSAHY